MTFQETEMKKIAVSFLIAIIPVALAAAGPYYCGSFFPQGRGFIMWIITLALAGLLIYFIYRGITEQNKNNIKLTSSSEAMMILKVRLAKGELNEDEYNRLKTRIYE